MQVASSILSVLILIGLCYFIVKNIIKIVKQIKVLKQKKELSKNDRDSNCNSDN